MNNPAPIPFLDAVAEDPLLQGQCKAATSLGQLVTVAEAAGFTVSVRDLQLWAHHEAFHAPWWPWAGGGKAQRRAFFLASSDETRQGAELGHTDYSHSYVE